MPQGYPDFRRQQDYDQFPAFTTFLGAAVNGNQTHGRFYVGSFAYLAARLRAGGVALEVLITWHSAQTGGFQTGNRRFILDDAVSGEFQGRFPNLGPFVEIELRPAGGAVNWTETCILWPSNRYMPIEQIPVAQTLLSVVTVNIAAGATLTTLFSEYYSGPATLLMQTGDAGDFIWEVQTLTGTWRSFAHYTLAAATEDTRVAILPIGACRLRIINQGAALGTYSARAVWSTSGG